MAKKKRIIVGTPLTPEILLELKALDNFPVLPGDFRPEGNWKNVYRIWTCHGYRKSGNSTNGILVIKRNSGNSGKSFSLSVNQKVVDNGGMKHLVDAEIECLNDSLASPVKWKLFNYFIHQNGKPCVELDIKEDCSVKGDIYEIKRAGRTYMRKGSSKLTGDWCLFEAIQRVPFKKNFLLRFDLLEGMSLFKEDHRLSYQGSYPIKVNGKDMNLHRFLQLGHGTYPYEYWLDNNHRLLMVITGARAYIFDAKGEEMRIMGKPRKSTSKSRKRR